VTATVEGKMTEKKAAKLRRQRTKDRIFQRIPHFLPRAQKLEKALETIAIALGLTLGTAKASWESAKEHAVI
jgi:hypothetical protein